MVTGNGDDTVIVTGQFPGAPTAVYTQGGNDTFYVGVTARSGYAGLTLDGGNDAGDTIALFDESGGATLQPVPLADGTTLFTVSYLGGLTSVIHGQNFAQWGGNLVAAG